MADRTLLFHLKWLQNKVSCKLTTVYNNKEKTFSCVFLQTPQQEQMTRTKLKLSPVLSVQKKCQHLTLLSQSYNRLIRLIRLIWCCGFSKANCMLGDHICWPKPSLADILSLTFFLQLCGFSWLCHQCVDGKHLSVSICDGPTLSLKPLSCPSSRFASFFLCAAIGSFTLTSSSGPCTLTP